MKGTFTNTILYIFVIFALSARLAYSCELFFSQHDKLLSAWIILSIIALLFGLTFLITSFFKGIKKNLKSLSIFAAALLIVFLFPFEYVFGWTLHQLNKAERNELVRNLSLGNYDSSIKENEYLTYGTWIKRPRIKVFKDSSIQMIFITRADITSYDYYATFFVSDISKINDERVRQFLNRECIKRYLGNNWYLVECYIDTTPGP